MQIALNAKAPRQIPGCETMPRTTVGDAVRRAAEAWSARMAGTPVQVWSRGLVSYEDMRHPYGMEGIVRVDGPATLREAVEQAILDAIAGHCGRTPTAEELAAVDGWL